MFQIQAQYVTSFETQNQITNPYTNSQNILLNQKSYKLHILENERLSIYDRFGLTYEPEPEPDPHYVTYIDLETQKIFYNPSTISQSILETQS